MDKDIKNNIKAIQDGATKKGDFNFKDVHVFTMPKGLKKASVQKNSEADSAKKTGFIILIFGSLFLLLLLAASYYFFVMKPNQIKVVDLDQVPSQEQAENKKAETKEVVPEKNNETSKVNNEIKKTDLEQEIQSPNNSQKVENREEIDSQQEQIDNEIIVDDISEEVAQVEKPFIVATVDNDNDGLSAKEEIAAGTSDSSPDTDSDSYADLAEMISGYNPLGEGLISDNINFKKFVNSQYSFSFYYPQTFEISANTNDAIILDLGNEDFFQLFIEVNKNKLNIEDWYKNQFGVNTIDSQLIFVNGDWNAIKKADSRSIFFKNNRDDYVIAFNYSSKNEGGYQNIFEIVFNTFKVLD